MRMTLESSNLLLLIDDAIQSSEVATRRLDEEVSVKEEALRKAEELCERLKIAEQEVSITTAQLHQIQEEFEYYLLLCRQQDQMLEKSADLQERAAILLANSNR